MKEIDEVNVMLDPAQKCLCVFVIDTYKSADVCLIDEISSGIQKILEDLKSDANSCGRIEVAFISNDCLSYEIRILQEPVPIYQAVIPTLKATTDDSSLIKALSLAMELVKTRESWYKNVGNPYCRSWVFLISNGLSLLSCNITSIFERIKQDTINKNCSFLLAYTKNAEMSLLREFESYIPITALASLNIMYYFKWLSSGVSDVCSPDPISFTNNADWMGAFIIGDSCNGELSSDLSEIEDGVQVCSPDPISFTGNDNWMDAFIIGDSCSGELSSDLSDIEDEAQLGRDVCADSLNNTMHIYSYESMPLGHSIEERAQLIAEETIAMSQLEQLGREEYRCREHIDKIRHALKEQKQIETHCMIGRGESLSAEIRISASKRLDSTDKVKELLNTRLTQLQNSASFFERLREKNELKMIKELLMHLESFEIEKKEMLQKIEALFKSKMLEAERQLSYSEIRAIKESVCFLESYLSDLERELHDLNDRRGYIEKELYKKRKESEMDEVYSSIFASAEVKRKSHMLVQVYLHLYEETEKVNALAQESDKDTERRDYIPLQCKLKKGDKVDVLLNIYGETLLMTDKKSVVWQGSFTKCSFDFFVPKDIDMDELSCVAMLAVNDVPIGEMRFITKIVNSPRQLNPEIIAHKYSKVFISYSHQDESKVKFLHEGLVLGSVPHFFDRKYLKVGDVFPKVIQEYINSADLFILCWSENASKSEYVQKERLQALERAYPQVQPEQAAKLRIYPMSIEPRAELPSDMKNYYHFGTL